MRKLIGNCLCGAVRFTFPDELKYALYCHCSECRRFSGSIFSVQGGIEKEKFTVEKGADDIGRYRKTEQSIMAFCKNCGSSLFVEKPKMGRVHFRFGALQEMPSLQPQMHVQVGSKVPWYVIRDDLPQFEGNPEIGKKSP